MAATFAYVRIQWQQRHGRGLRKTQTAPFAARLFATAELGCPACWSWPRVRRTLSSASGNPPFVLCQRPQQSFLLPRLRPGGAISCALSSCLAICLFARALLTSSSTVLFQPILLLCLSKPPLFINSNSIATPRRCAI